MMNATQKELFTILIKFDSICRENDIEYILAGGLALGAVRNGGFLPWDDDVDILIKRDQYEKLDRILSENPPEGIAWVTEDNTPEYFNPIPRFADDNTTLFFQSMASVDMPKGYHLELFVMDPYPDDPQEQMEYRRMLWLYTELRNPYFTSAHAGLPLDMTDRRLYEDYRTRAQREGMDQVIRQIRSYLTSFDEKDCHLWCGRWSRNIYLYEDAWVSKRREIEIEGRSLPIARGVFHQMRENYDSQWNQIPEEKKQHTHRFISSLTESWRERAPEVRRICDKYQYTDHITAAKPIGLDTFFARKERDGRGVLLLRELLKREIQRLEKDRWTFDLRHLDVLAEQLKRCIDYLCYPAFVRFEMALPMREDLRETILLLLIHQDRYEDACRLAERSPGWDKADHYQKILHELGELKLEKYYENCGAATDYLEELKHVPKLKGQIEMERTGLWLLTKDGKTRSAKEIRGIERGLNWKGDAENLKYIGDLLEAAGEMEAAESYYLRAASDTRNGMLLYDLVTRGILKSVDAVPKKTEESSFLGRGINKLKRLTMKDRPLIPAPGKIMTPIRTVCDPWELAKAIQKASGLSLPETIEGQSVEILLREICALNRHIEDNKEEVRPHNEKIEEAYNEMKALYESSI